MQFLADKSKHSVSIPLQYIKEYCKNEQEYQLFFQWKQKDIRPQFIEKAQLQKTSPFIRLCEILGTKRDADN